MEVARTSCGTVNNNNSISISRLVDKATPLRCPSDARQAIPPLESVPALTPNSAATSPLDSHLRFGGESENLVDAGVSSSRFVVVGKNCAFPLKHEGASLVEGLILPWRQIHSFFSINNARITTTTTHPNQKKRALLMRQC